MLICQLLLNSLFDKNKKYIQEHGYILELELFKYSLTSLSNSCQ